MAFKKAGRDKKRRSYKNILRRKEKEMKMKRKTIQLLLIQLTEIIIKLITLSSDLVETNALT